jgi:hypothetical protein
MGVQEVAIQTATVIIAKLGVFQIVVHPLAKHNVFLLVVDLVKQILREVKAV